MVALCFCSVMVLMTWILFPLSVVGTGGLLGLPSADQIENLAIAYQDTLSLQFGQQRVFPVLEFQFHGRIIGWTFAATENTGQRSQRPFLTTWTVMNSVTFRYSLNTPASSLAEQLDECVSSTTVLKNGMEVFIHDSGPMEPGLNFSTGDRLGFYFQTQNNADFIPYLYSGLLQSEANADVDGNFSAAFPANNFRRGRVIDARSRDQLLPLIALKLCSFEDVGIEGVSICNGTTSRRSAEACANLRITTAAPIAATTEVTTTMTTREGTTTMATEDAAITTTEDSATATTENTTTVDATTMTTAGDTTTVTIKDATTMTTEDAAITITEDSATATTEDTTTVDATNATTMTTARDTTTVTTKDATTMTAETATTEDTTTADATSMTTAEDIKTMTTVTATTTKDTTTMIIATTTEIAAITATTATETAATTTPTELEVATTRVAANVTIGAATTHTAINAVTADTSGGGLPSGNLPIMVVTVFVALSTLHCY